MSSDLVCPVCGELWDLDTLHEAAGELGVSFGKVWKAFRSVGCAAFDGSDYESGHGPALSADRAADVRAVYALMGSDVDGACATLEDFGLLGY